MAPFVPRERKHKKRQRFQDGDLAPDGSNPNAPVVVPASAKERNEKKSAMKAALRAQQPKMSSKKQKRLDKYIVSVRKRRYGLVLTVKQG